MIVVPGRHHDQPPTAFAATEDRVNPVVHARLKARYDERSLVKTLKFWPVIRHARKNRVERRISVLEIRRLQKFFLRRYWHFFRRFVLAREATIFER